MYSVQFLYSCLCICPFVFLLSKFSCAKLILSRLSVMPLLVIVIHRVLYLGLLPLCYLMWLDLWLVVTSSLMFMRLPASCFCVSRLICCCWVAGNKAEFLTSFLPPESSIWLHTPSATQPLHDIKSHATDCSHVTVWQPFKTDAIIIMCSRLRCKLLSSQLEFLSGMSP